MHRWFEWFGLERKFVLTVLLSLLALGMALVFRTPARWLMAAAMLCSSLGDLILANWRGLGSRMPIPSFYAGMLCFIAAHILYAAAFAGLVRRQGASVFNPGGRLALLLAAAVGTAVVIAALRRPGVDLRLLAACTGYLCIIGWMLMNVFALAWSAKGVHILTALGAFSFFLSDVIIGLVTLVHITAYSRYIWWLYPIGQLLMLLFA